MKNLFKDKKKLILFAGFILVTLAACSNPRLDDGTIDPAKVISLDTSFGEVFGGGWFDGLLVYPVAQLINLVGSITGDAGLAIIISTLIINAAVAAMTLNAQMSQQKIQMCKPEMDKIQAKYKGRRDEKSRQMQAQELQKLYKENGINPFGSILPLLVQMPVLFAVYYAVMRAEAVIGGSFLGILLDTSPLAGMSDGVIGYAIIFGLMVIAQFSSLKVPKIIAKRRKEKEEAAALQATNGKKKSKKYAQAKAQTGNGMEKSMNAMMYVSLTMMSFLCLNWPASMSFYWLVNACTRMVQNIAIDKIVSKKKEKDNKVGAIA